MADGNEPVSTVVDSVGATGGTSEFINPVPSNTGTSSTGARRPASLPSIKTNIADKSHMLQNHQQPHHQPQVQQIHQIQYNTFPPMTPIRSAASAVGPSPASGLFPPNPNHHGKGTPTSSNSVSVTGNRRGTSPMGGIAHGGGGGGGGGGGTASILGSGGTGMTESPRALSPAQVDPTARAKSPLGQFGSGKQQQYAPPMTPLSAQPQNPSSALSSQFGPPSGTTQHIREGQKQQQVPQSSQQQAPQASMGFPQPNQQHQSGRPLSSSGGGNQNPNIFENERGVWDYVKELERRIVELETKQRGYDAILAQAQQSLAVAATAQLAAVSGNNQAAAGGGNGGQ